MKVSPSRAAAFDVLLRIEKEKAFSSVLLPVVEEGLSTEDRGLCHELVLGTLRKQIYLDRLISILSVDRKIDDEVRIALRLAIYQLKFLDRIPAHSAVNESVNLVQRARKSSARGFVNAVLRRLLREDVDLEFEDEIDRLSVETSHPRWLLEKWGEDFGPDAAENIAKANDLPPPITFRVLDPAFEQEAAGMARSSEYVPGCYIAERNERRLIELGHGGEVYFQDEASQMVAHSVNVPERGTVLDVCASPGGKTGILAEKTQENSGSIFAGDLTPYRIGLLKENCRRQGIELNGIVHYDATKHLPFQDGIFDNVLVDAPCSGTGTIRHNPEVRYIVRPDDPSRFADKQLAILISASEMVRPGGQLVYSTCSLEKEENEAVCEDFVRRASGFVLVEPAVSSRFLTESGHARTRPDRDGMDGFFMASFRRK